jgi:hypothetical protein
MKTRNKDCLAKTKKPTRLRKVVGAKVRILRDIRRWNNKLPGWDGTVEIGGAQVLQSSRINGVWKDEIVWMKLDPPRICNVWYRSLYAKEGDTGVIEDIFANGYYYKVRMDSDGSLKTFRISSFECI